MKTINWHVFVLLVGLSGVISYNYATFVSLPNTVDRRQLHDAIIRGEAPSPYVYRVLIPHVNDGVRFLLRTGLSDSNAFTLSYFLSAFFAISAFLVTLFLWLLKFFKQRIALVGVLIVSSLIPLSLRDHFFQPWSLLEPAFFCWGLLAIHERKHRQLLGIIVLATLNRETGVFIALAYLASEINLTKGQKLLDRASLLRATGYLGLWFVVFGGLRLGIGQSAHIHTLHDIWLKNISSSKILLVAGVHWLLFLGGLWYYWFKGLAGGPDILKRLSLILPVYLASILLFGVWYEVRLLLPLYAIFIPLALHHLQHAKWLSD